MSVPKKGKAAAAAAAAKARVDAARKKETEEATARIRKAAPTWIYDTPIEKPSGPLSDAELADLARLREKNLGEDAVVRSLSEPSSFPESLWVGVRDMWGRHPADRAVSSPPDPELAAIAACVGILDRCSGSAASAGRIVEYLWRRYSIDRS